MAETAMLITGAAGMIGSGLVRYLNDQGHTRLFLVDDLQQTDQWKNLLHKRFVDFIARRELFPWLEKHGKEIQTVFHLGACSDTLETDGNFLIENNFRFTVQLAQWALSEERRFIYASSAATYGDGAQGFSDDETHLLRLTPLNLYGFSKHLVDLWMQQQGVLDRVVGLKYFNVFGPNEYHKGRMASMLLKMSNKVQKEGKVQLYCSNDSRFVDGGQQRDFIYLKDAVKMTYAFADPAYRKVHGIFNIGRGTPTTWNDLAGALFTAHRLPTQIEYIPMPDTLGGQYQNYTCAEMKKFHQFFPVGSPYAASFSMQEGVQDYVCNYLIPGSRW